MTDSFNGVLEIIKTLSAIVPFLLLGLLSSKVNLKREIRDRQFLMPVFTVVFVILTMIFLKNINDGILGLISGIPKLLDNIIKNIPSNFADFLKTPLDSLKNWINSLDLKYWVFYISNTLIIAAYLIIKRIIISILKKVNEKERPLHTRVAGLFYQYFAEKDMWYLRDDYVQARTFSKVAFYTVLVLMSLLMLISGRLYVFGLLADVFYPVFSVILVGEVYFFLNGVSKAEYLNDVLGEDEESYRTANYSLMRKYLRDLFGDKLLIENTNVNISLSNDITNNEVIENLLNDMDPKVVAFATYYDKLNKDGFDLDHNYLRSSLDLLNGKSILFNNPFYKDLIPYAFYPMNRTLLSQKKVLIVLGRHSVEEDIVKWIEDGIEAVTNIPFLWRTGILSKTAQDLDIGIITRSDVINMEVHNANRAFLEQVGFMVVLEPSKLITTAQIGLNLLVKTCRDEGEKNIVFCLCDKNCDGLIDAMSHILMTNLTEVSATEKHNGTSSYMCWDADDSYMHHRQVPNVSRYLGVGTELSFAALKNQTPHTSWYGGQAFPVTDMNWIDRQYYYDLMKYAELPTDQELMDEYFYTTPNFWSAEAAKNNYITVEDESCNMFEILRNFSTRSTEQGFINVISSSYMLKDYMASNYTVFETDAKAIPCIVADYARTKRNVVLELILMLSRGFVSDKRIQKEFSLVGLPTLNTGKQLWHEIYRTLSPVKLVSSLPSDYAEAVDYTYDKKLILPGGDALSVNEVLTSDDRYSLDRGELQHGFSIINEAFFYSFVNSLKSASYISEDEKGERYYLGAELRDHIYQKLLPGQFFTYSGKYYEMLYTTYDGQVLVRRAADHIDGRPSYRQIRKYRITDTKVSEKIGAVRDIGGIRLTNLYADFSVTTEGYYKMNAYNDFTTAKKVVFEGEKSRIPDRIYINKQIQRIDLPNTDGALTNEIRYTITLLLNEVFKTLFAENAPYIAALTDISHVGEDVNVNPMTYSLETACESPENCIYIIEDSGLDMGLLVAVERNLLRILRIIEDYLSWNKGAIAYSIKPPKTEEPLIIDPNDNDFELGKEKKDGLFKRIGKAFKQFFQSIGNFFKKLFKRKKKDPVVPEEPQPEIPQEPVPEEPQPEIPQEPVPEEPQPETPQEPIPIEPRQETPQEPIPIEPRQETPQEPVPDEHQPEKSGETEGISPEKPVENMALEEKIQYPDSGSTFPEFVRKPYHKRYYLLYGDEGEPDVIDSNGTLSYLKGLQLGNNPLKEVRKNRKLSRLVEASFRPNRKNVRCCDFCGKEIYGVEFETLVDGRDRCISCGRTAVKTEEEFIKIFDDVKRNMESFFDIRINTGVKVEMVNATKLHKRLGQSFVPTSGYDGRVLGVAIRKHGKFTLMIENGSPRMSTILTMAHELTHIWQYLNWDEKDILRKYGKKLNLQIYEGMAKWVEVQYACLINELGTAKREELITMNRADEYGFGYIRYKANYPITTGTVIARETPFDNIELPLDPMYCGSDVSALRIEDNSAEFDVPLDDDDYTSYFDSEEEDDEKDITPETPTDAPVLKPVIQRTPGSVPLYAFETLNDSEKEFYQRVVSAIESFETTIDALPEWMTLSAFEKIRTCVTNDHPELFWYEGDFTYYQDSASSKLVRIELTYSMSEVQAENRKLEIENAVPVFLAGITEDTSDYDAVKTVYENIIKLTDYDHIGLKKEDSGKSSVKPDDLRSVYGVLVNRKAVCAGYAKTTQYLLNRLGIECTYVSGTTNDDGRHAWNLIKLEGEYYFMDTTWDDRSSTDASKSTSREITYNYFCITTAEMNLDHTPDTTIPLPPCTSRQCDYYYRTGKLKQTYSFQAFRNAVKYCVQNGERTIAFKYTDEEQYRKMLREIIDNKKFFEVIQYLNMTLKVHIKSSYSYVKYDKKLILRISLQ